MIMKRMKKDGTVDKRFKSVEEMNEMVVESVIEGNKRVSAQLTQHPVFEPQQDPNELHERLLKEHGLQLDFDVIDGTIPTKFGIIKIDKPTLVIKATYVQE